MYKQVSYYELDECINHAKYKPQPDQENNRYKNFNQTIYTAGDVDQFMSKLKYTNQDIINTFNYIYHKFKKGIFVHIKNNKLLSFIPFSKCNYVNEWSHLLTHYNVTNIMNKLKSRYNRNKSHWYANNFIIRNEYPIRENDSGINQLYDMLVTLCNKHTIKDCYFFLNKRDFPLLKKNKTEPYEDIFGPDEPLISHKYEQYAPILSMTTNDNFNDIAIPNWDDWTHTQCINHNKYFSKPLLNKSHITDFCHDWNLKQNIAVFRGSSTGKGTNNFNNTRMKLCNMKSQYLDVGITNWNNRPRITRRSNRITLHSFNNTNKQKSSWLTPKEQSNYKYIINVNGHSSAYRLFYELSMMSVILLVDCDYKLWFSDKLVPHVHYIPIKSDLSNLIDTIEWCINNDDACKEIATNALKFYNEVLDEQGILNFMSITINNLSNEDVKQVRKKNYKSSLILNYKKNEQLFDALVKFNTDCIIKSFKNITVYKSQLDFVCVRKKVTDYEAYVSLFGVNKMLNEFPDNFTYSYCYKDGFLYMRNVEGVQFQEWLISSDFSMNKYIRYLYKITEIISMYQESKFKFVHYDLSPWNIMLNDDNIVIIDYEKSCVCVDKKCSLRKYSSIIDVLSILLKSVNTILHCIDKYKFIKGVEKEDEEILLNLLNFVTDTKYRRNKFMNLYEAKEFVNNMAKYDNLLEMPKYDLEQKNAKKFSEYLLSTFKNVVG